MDKFYLAALHMVSGLGSIGIRKLVEYFGSAQQVWNASKQDIVMSGLVGSDVCDNLLSERKKISVDKLLESWQNRKIKLCSIYEDEYPVLLRSIYNPPLVLYYKGVLPADELTLAMVGSRRASAYGRNAAHFLAGELARNGIIVVSGAARGIDTAAHKGALSKGRTVAVLGCGVDISYPPENSRLFEQIADNGAVLSEYAPGTLPHPGYFPARNRIINGLSRGVIVVEAGFKSGALITCDYALEEGRDVFAVPGSMFAEQSKGTHRLIKQGAKLVDCVEDILEEYGIKPGGRLDCSAAMTMEEELVYNTLAYDSPVSLDDIITKTGLDTSKVAFIILSLELRGLAVECSKQNYLKAAKEGN